MEIGIRDFGIREKVGDWGWEIRDWGLDTSLRAEERSEAISFVGRREIGE